uniref:Choline transporter-like protein n=1 Tax=Albugo laibachii Nc14 TaxID=890382 RepID=F0W878_9STRA|nr:conserved hypothetical protein [Albugo laibachii Nc14]|eukprot:CCA17362.1 conserved hypothetical protein [Albugo laibachii Nc14]
MEMECADSHALLAEHNSHDRAISETRGNQNHEHSTTRNPSGMNTSTKDVLNPNTSHQLRYCDSLFTYLLGLNVAVVVFMAVAFGLPNMSNLYFTIHPSASSHGIKLFGIAILTSVLAAFISFLWLDILQRHALRVLSATVRLSILVCLVLGIISFYDAGIGGRAFGFINLFSSFFLFLYYMNSRPSMAFASSNLRLGVRILQKFPQVFYFTGKVVLVQGIWTVIWLGGVLGILSMLTYRLHDANASGYVAIFALLLSYFWTVQVCKNVVHCVVAGTVGEWWYGSSNSETVLRAKVRTLSSSFGSVCLGSLVVAFLSTARTFLDLFPRRGGRQSANACLDWISGIVMHHAQYLNKFAFCHVAIYGSSLGKAGTDTLALLRNRGWTALVNDSLISNVLSVGGLMVGLLSGGIGASWLYVTLNCTETEVALHPEECETFNVVILSFVICSTAAYAICSTISSVLESAVITVFICFAEDPAVFERYHPREHLELVTAWSTYKPDLFLQSV